MGEIEKRDNSESYSETELSEIKVIEQVNFMKTLYMIHFKETEISDSEEVSALEDKGDIKNMENKNEIKEESGKILENCSISCEEKVIYGAMETISDYKGHENCDEKVQTSSCNWWFIISSSLVVLTVICFISGSYLAVRTKTSTDTISLTGY